MEEPRRTPEATAERLAALAREHGRVVRLAADDPLSSEGVAMEAESLFALGVPFGVMPGLLPETAAAYARQPLAGKRVLVTRAAGQAEDTAALLRDHGAEPWLFPVLTFEPPEDGAGVDAAIAELVAGRYGVVLFTSRNGVAALFSALARAGRDTRALAGALVCAIGPGTAAALVERGLRPDLIAREHVGEGLARDVLEALAGARPRVLLARAAVARDALPEALRSAGLTVDVVPVYVTRPASVEAKLVLVGALRRGEIDAVTLASSSTVELLLQALASVVGEEEARGLLGGTVLASIGPVTTGAALRRGLAVEVTAERYTMSGLVDALVAHFAFAASAI